MISKLFGLDSKIVLGAAVATTAVFSTVMYVGLLNLERDSLTKIAATLDNLDLRLSEIEESVLLSRNLKSVLAVDEEFGGVRIGDSGWLSSRSLEVYDSVSETFTVPRSFTGQVILNGPGVKHQKFFLVGSDTNANFTQPNGFIKPLGDFQLPRVEIEYIEPNRWRLIGLLKPQEGSANRVEIALLGVAPPLTLQSAEPHTPTPQAHQSRTGLKVANGG